MPRPCAERGIHPPERIPFYFPWTDAPAGDLARSWLGQEHQGRGLGTLMRQVVCASVFDHLDGTEVTSAAFLDNPASLAVSRKVGYRDHGVTRRKRREGELALLQFLVLHPDDLVRAEAPLEVEGLAAFRRSIGLDGG